MEDKGAKAKEAPMHAHHVEEIYAESWLTAARERVIDGIERMTEVGGLSRSDYFLSMMAVKLDCVVAIVLATLSLCAYGLEALWYSGKQLLFHTGDSQKTDQAWESFHRSLDVLLSGVTGLFDSHAVLTAADRGNIRKICDLGRKIQDVQANPSLNPDTKKELDTWYRNTKVFLRTGGGEVTREMQGLDKALEMIRSTPETEPERLKSWRWGTSMAVSPAAKKVRDIGVIGVESPLPTEDITKRAWKKK